MDWGFIIRLGVCTALFAVGGYFLKLYADAPAPLWLITSLAAYMVGCVLFANILRLGLGYGMVLSTMLELCIMVLIGALFFGEKLGPSQYAGLACAISAMALFSLPHSAS